MPQHPIRKPHRRLLPTLAAFAALLLFGTGLFALAIDFAGHERDTYLADLSRPQLGRTRPAADDTGVVPTTAVAADIRVPPPAAGRVSNGVDPASLVDAAVFLYKKSDGPDRRVPAKLNTSGANDIIVLNPENPLAVATTYVFEVTDQLKDENGTPFEPHKIEFTTAAGVASEAFPVAFEKVDLPTEVDRSAFTALTIGPDGRLYAGTFDGRIERYAIQPDGTLGEPQTISTLIAANHGPRLITGLAFSPQSTADRPELWVSHGQLKLNAQHKLEGAEEWTGAISLLSGPDLDRYRDLVIHLPRAYKDHLNFQGAFGPDGAYYFNQGSHTSAGAPDDKWGQRPERLLSAATLRIDPALLPTDHPLDVRTPDGGGTYRPDSADAPLTIYATGVRSGFDLLWHSNGHLYSGINGSAAGGNCPAGGGAPAIGYVTRTADDLLLDIKPGVYYGHPNPARGEFVLHGANPTAGPDPQEVPDYPVGTQPNPRYRPPAFSFGKNVSPDGLIEYRAPASKPFGGRLDGAILVTRWSVGDDVIALIPDKDGKITESITGIDGLGHFTDPLDLVEDPKTGNLYVAEYGGKKITLARPIQGGVSKGVFREMVK